MRNPSESRQSASERDPNSLRRDLKARFVVSDQGLAFYALLKARESKRLRTTDSPTERRSFGSGYLRDGLLLGGGDGLGFGGHPAGVVGVARGRGQDDATGCFDRLRTSERRRGQKPPARDGPGRPRLPARRAALPVGEIRIPKRTRRAATCQ